MRVAVEDTRAEVVAFYKQQHQSIKRGRWLVAYVLPCVLGVLGLLIQQLVRIMPLDPLHYFLISCVGLLCFACAPILVVFNFPTVKHQVKIGTPFTAELREDGIYLQHAGKNDLVPWSAVRRIEHENEYLFLSLQRRGGLFIPDRAFESAAEAEAFMHCAKARWDAAKSLAILPLAAP